MLGSESDLRMYVKNLGYPLPYKLGPPKPPIFNISQLNDNFNGLYLPNET